MCCLAIIRQNYYGDREYTEIGYEMIHDPENGTTVGLKEPPNKQIRQWSDCGMKIRTLIVVLLAAVPITIAALRR